MSSSIWTRCAGDSELRRLRVSPWRVVESQFQLSTRKLVDSAAEQELLEDLIDTAKPPAASTRQHYLLTTPFRYPPLRHGSRLGTRSERGIWYGSESIATAFAEVAYYRLVFLDGARTDLGTVVTQHSAFTVRATGRGIDLTRPPFDAFRDRISSPSRYADSQPLGAAMREAGAEIVRYVSARDPEGTNVGIFTPSVFGGARPRALEPWYVAANRSMVEAVKRDYFGADRLVFPRSRFLVRGNLPAPAT